MFYLFFYCLSDFIAVDPELKFTLGPQPQLGSGLIIFKNKIKKTNKAYLKLKTHINVVALSYCDIT